MQSNFSRLVLEQDVSPHRKELPQTVKNAASPTKHQLLTLATSADINNNKGYGHIDEITTSNLS